jgi:selenide,water dikinase
VVLRPLAIWGEAGYQKHKVGWGSGTMQNSDWPLVRDLVLIGGGHAHALVVRKWGMAPQPGVRLTVINPSPVAPYTGMLPGHIAGHYRRDEMMIDLVRLARFAGARAVMDLAIGLDRAAKIVILASGRRLRYDVASLDIGIGSELPQLEGFTAHGFAAKPLGVYADRWEAFVATAPEAPRVTVIGAGVGGAELAMASAYRLRQSGLTPQITLLERAETALPQIGAGARSALLAQLQALGVTLKTGAEPASIQADAVVLRSGEVIGSDFTLSVAGARPQDWLTQTGLALTNGFVDVGPSLQSSDPMVFASGDCAHMTWAPRPKAGVFAVRQAPFLLHNMRAALCGGQMRQFQPQRDYLKLISTGSKRAVADKFGLRLEGEILWRWKDQIDRKFIAEFADYPVMPVQKIPTGAATGLAEALGEKPLCGGCGAKVGAQALAKVLADLPAPQRADVLSGPGDDAAILQLATGLQVLTTDHLRVFTADAALMARITATHALGDIWAMGAAPQTALVQITLPRLGAALQADMLAEVMAAAGEVIREAGAEIVGGHTSIGAELTIGFTLTGLADRVITKGGAQLGDALILTKPIGTGVVLAAEMAAARVPGLLLGESVAACFASMQRSLAGASAILAPHAHAMTDVTGFGLAGHLLEIMQAAGLSARLDLAAVPLLPGVEAIAAAGHASSLAAANRAMSFGSLDVTQSPRADLLFDPQTAGGLLAAVPMAQAKAICADLRAAGDEAAIIGTVGAGPVGVTVVG